jgi:hypothetical protein
MATDFADLVCTHVLSCENCKNTWETFRRANVNRTYRSMSMRRANNLEITPPRQRDVVDVAALAGDKSEVFQPIHRARPHSPTTTMSAARLR